MKVFISGVAGFLGSHLADSLINQGVEVVGVDNLVGGQLKNVNSKVEFHQEDCGNLKKMNEYMKGCDVVFHAACTAHDGLSLFSPYYITHNTFGITMSVLSAAAQNKIKKFIYCSSMSRYGEQETLPFIEEMDCNPRVPYGVAKYAAELVIRQICELNDIYFNIVVPHNIVGPRQRSNDPFRNVAAIMINRVLQGKQPIIYGDGEQKRCFSDIEDVIYCIEQLIFRNDLNGEIFNIGPDEEFVSINELAKIIANELKFNLHPIYVPARPNEVKYATCSAEKARRILNYKTKVDLKTSIKRMVDYIKKDGAEEFEYNYDIEIINDKTPKTWKDKMI